MKDTGSSIEHAPNKARPKTGSYSPFPSTLPQHDTVPRRHWIKIVGVVIIAILGMAIIGLVFFYPDFQRQQALQAARSREQDSARLAVSQLKVTCFSSTIDESHLTNSTQTRWPGYVYHYTGYLIINQTFGVHNPSQFQMNATLLVDVSFTYSGQPTPIESVARFRLSPNGTTLAMTSYLINSTWLPDNRQAQLSDFQLALQGGYTVDGSLATYLIVEQTSSTYLSTKPPGSGIFANISNLSSC